MRLSLPITNRSIWFAEREIAVTGEPGEATPPATWPQDPQPLVAFHQFDMIRPSGAVVNRSRWSRVRDTTVTVESGRQARLPGWTHPCQPVLASHHAVWTRLFVPTVKRSSR